MLPTSNNGKVLRVNDHQRYYEHERFFALIDKIKAKPWHWIVLSLMMVLGDFVTGSLIQFPFLYIFPVSLAAWAGNRTHAYTLAILLPATRIPMAYLWNTSPLTLDLAINFAIRAFVLAGLVHLLSFVQGMRVLRGMLNACSYCHRIKTSEGDWITTEKFIVQYSEAILSHGICPECATIHWGKVLKEETKAES